MNEFLLRDFLPNGRNWIKKNSKLQFKSTFSKIVRFGRRTYLFFVYYLSTLKTAQDRLGNCSICNKLVHFPEQCSRFEKKDSAWFKSDFNERDRSCWLRIIAFWNLRIPPASPDPLTMMATRPVIMANAWKRLLQTTLWMPPCKVRENNLREQINSRYNSSIGILWTIRWGS